MSQEVLTEAEIREILESAGWTKTFSSPARVIDYQRSADFKRGILYNRVLIYASDLPRYNITRTKLEKLMAETNLSKHAEILLGLVDPVTSVTVTNVGTIATVKDRTDLSLVTDSQDVKTVKEYFGNAPELADFGGFFVKVEGGEYTEVYGFEGNVPYLYKTLWKIEPSSSSLPKRVFVSSAALIPGASSEAVVREEEIPTFTPAFLSEVERAWKEKRSTSFWDWLMEPVQNGVTVTLRGTKKPHEFFPKDIIERMKYDSIRQVYVVTPKPFKTWRVWFTTPMGFERFVDVEAITEEEAKTKATPQAPPGSEYRYAAIQE